MQTAPFWVFDLDGTLVDSCPAYFQTLRNLFDSYKVQYNDQDILRSLTMHSSKYLPLYIPTQHLQMAQVELQMQSEKNSAKVQAYEGIHSSLATLQKNGARMAVWTGRDLVSALMILKNTGLESYFDLCVSGTCVVNHKPHPEGLHRIIEYWNCKPESVVMVGDHDVDMVGAKETNVYSVRVSWGDAQPTECKLANKRFYKTSEFSNWLGVL
jgi:HAD superfamily hydrolase (TIGR01549 family)